MYNSRLFHVGQAISWPLAYPGRNPPRQFPATIQDLNQIGLADAHELTVCYNLP